MLEFLKRYFLILFLVLLCLPIPMFAVNNDGSRYAENSVLSEGKWFKIKIPATGVYKLTYDDLKNKIGLSNPADVKVFGYGGWILDEDFSKPYVDDLPPVSIWMSSEPENFGKGDYILFYARGDIKWEYNEKKKEFEQTQNPYSSGSYYFITESVSPPVLMNKETSLPASSNVVTTFNDYVLHEKELKNIGKSGRVFYGEDFTNKSTQEFTLETDGATTDPATVRYDFVYYTTFPGGQTLTATLEDGSTKTTNTVAITGSKEKDFTFGDTINETIVTTNLQKENKITLAYNKVASDKNLYLNYIRINYKRTLKSYGAVTFFRDVDNRGDDLTYQISDATSSMIVLDVTDNNLVKQIETQLNGSTMTFTASNSALKEYALVDLSGKIPIPTPTIIDKSDSRVGSVEKQNLHALSGYDMIIIAQPFLKSEAQALADLHEKDSGFKSLVVNPEDIYNEFSSGNPDITAYRRFLKMFYDRAEGGDNRPQYLLLFGGGTYDNRLISKTWTEEEKKSMLLTYQSKNSLMETTSYVTDDYLGFLDDSDGQGSGDGDPNDNFLDKCVLKVSVGRLPVRTKQQGTDVLSKIKGYLENENKGIWQNNILYVSDDLVGSKDNTNEDTFIKDAESLANYSNENYPNFVTNKIYEDAYERVIEANGPRYPAATAALIDRIDRGTLFLNFIGHGSVSAWTHENLLTYSDIEGLKNNKLGLWITATCDFSRFDADAKSAGELALLQKNGGAIGLYSTVRTAYISDNSKINNNINKYILKRGEDGKAPRIGDIMRKAKSESNMIGDGNKLRFALLGDPALRLSFPDDNYTVEVTEMNDRDASDNNINIEALGNNVIIGHIVDKNGEVATNFNGTIESVIYDSEQELRTKGNKLNGSSDRDRGLDYKAYTNILFSGKVKVIDGVFRIEFVAPKDILYANGKGKMSFLAYEDEGSNEAQGSFFNYTVGGTNPNLPEDTDGPVIEEIYLNKDTFKSGDRVNPTPLFYARVSDENGINISSYIGHNMLLIVDGYTEYDLTPYFENEGNSSKKGSVSFRMPELSLGNHTLQFRVWDVANNSTMSDPIDFVVTDDIQATTYSFEIWGSPAKNNVKFVFRTETPNENVSIKLSVYTLTGQMVWTDEARGAADSLSQYIYDWNLSGDGGRVPPGVYICKAQIMVNGKTSSVKSKKFMVASY